MFDWVTFLNRRGIEYTDRGSSATAGNLAIHCVFCGAADPGTHLAISLHGRGWRCWRNKAHSGRSPVRLIQALLGCTWVEAERLAGVSSARSTVAQNDFGAHVAGLLVGSAKTPVDGKPLD